MIVLNFGHPLTEEHLLQVQSIVGERVEEVRDVDAQIDPDRELVSQVVQKVDELGYSPQEWQTLPFLLNPPSLNVIAVVLIAELHGRMGYFPPVLRLRPVAGALPPRFEVAEVINLQLVREHARQKRRPR